MKTVNILSDYDQIKTRMSLPKPTWTGREEISTGIFLTAIYVSPRAKRMVIETDSIWENPVTHECVGTTYRLIEDEQLILEYADYDGVGAALEKCGMVKVESL